MFEQAITLANGKYEGQPAEPGAASRPTAVLWEPTFHTADLDGVIGSEALAMLSSNAGGSGEFVSLAVFGMRDGAFANVATVPVGDRVRLQSLWLERGKVIMDVIEPGPNDAACCPTQVSRKTFGYDDGTFKQVSSEVRGMLALSMLSANEWTLVEIDGQPLSADLDPPLIHFEAQRLRGFAGCNRFTASGDGNQARRDRYRRRRGGKEGVPAAADGARAEIPRPARRREPLQLRRRAAGAHLGRR